jgi:hypothetical protein
MSTEPSIIYLYLEKTMNRKSQLFTLGCVALSTGIAHAQVATPADSVKKIAEPLVLDAIIVKAQSANNPDQPFESQRYRANVRSYP